MSTFKNSIYFLNSFLKIIPCYIISNSIDRNNFLQFQKKILYDLKSIRELLLEEHNNLYLKSEALKDILNEIKAIYRELAVNKSIIKKPLYIYLRNSLDSFSNLLIDNNFQRPVAVLILDLMSYELNKD